MRLVVAVHGTRGDVEPCAAVALEMTRRGHEVRMAVPPNLVSLVESAGLSPVTPWGPDSESRALQWNVRAIEQWAATHPSHELKQRPQGGAPHTKSVMPNPFNAVRQFQAYLGDCWDEMSETLKTLAEGADLILTGMTYQEVAANVAEFHGIPLATMHFCPVRANTSSLPVRIPRPIADSIFAFTEWAYWRAVKTTEDRQRRALRLPKAKKRSARRIVERGTLEIQAYDEAFFPGLSAQWGGKRPLVGSITLQLPTEDDQAVSEWIADGKPPIYFGFGSMPVADPAEAIAMISAVSAELGERALICSGVLDLDNVTEADHVKIVRSVNHAAVFPRCRAIIHHGGAGTTAASVRAGVPTLVLWVGADQPLWASRITGLKIGASQKFSKITHASLSASLRKVLEPDYTERARAFAARMIRPADAVALTADLLEDAAAVPQPGSRAMNWG